MKRIAFAIIFIITASFAIGQDFAPVGAKWYFEPYLSSPHLSDYFTVEVIGDTVINGKDARIIKKKSSGEVKQNSTAYIRDTNRKVFVYEDGQFRLLYDFNLEAGDTLTHYAPTFWDPFHLNCSFLPDSQRIFNSIVDSTDTLSIDGKQLKTLYMQRSGWYFKKIVERIGSYRGIFGEPSPACLGGDPGHFRCYQDSTINYKAVDEACDHRTLQSTPKRKIQDLSISPNPAESVISVHAPRTFITQYQLYTIQGKLLAEAEGLKTHRHNIDLSSFDQGVYLLELRDSDGHRAVQKIIKQ